MPTYDYLCSDCNRHFEVRQKFSDEPLTICPECAGRVQRVIHAPYAVHYSWKAPSFLTSESDRIPRYTKTAETEQPF